MSDMPQAPLVDIVVNALDDLKAQDIKTLAVSELTSVMDYLVVATGSSNRHVKSIASNAIDEAKKLGFRLVGMEGMDAGEWVLVDFGDVVVHVMQQATRDLYELEKLWSVEPPTRKSAGAGHSEHE